MQRDEPTITIVSPFRSGVLDFNREAVLRDYRIGVRSRHASVIGRQEVLTGRAKFGAFGDGKEVPQLAMAYAFRPGDVRSGYYRDQTFMMALELMDVRQMFSQLYGHADPELEPMFSGRSMPGHFATRTVDGGGRFLSQVERYNSSADISPTASQMPRLVGLGYASRLYRELRELDDVASRFSDNGNEVAFGTIGNASCAEGLFWESINAIGVLGAPVIVSIWDDEYGISVPNEYQMTKGDVGQVVQGFQRSGSDRPGFDLYVVPGWDYPLLCETYLRAADSCRRDHIPALIHVTELTQPQGHSTSGSHERYKSSERLQWERDNDCLVKMKQWIESEGLASADELEAIDQEERGHVERQRDAAWKIFRAEIDAEREELLRRLDSLQQASAADEAVAGRLHELRRRIERRPAPLRRQLLAAAHEGLRETLGRGGSERAALAQWLEERRSENEGRYGSHLHSESPDSALLVAETAPEYPEEPETINGYEVLNRCFDSAFARHPQLFAFGEDVGHLGDVNQAMANLQERYGVLRITDTGIREATILGQAIGMAMRGLRPIAEMQYLDYILYALQLMSDDLATLRWRTRGGQAAPVIVRTRGHRLEGIWHSGSPMAGILNLCRGLYVCVPRDMTRAAGFYNTLLRSDDAALVVEVLNGYRRKEPLPSNLDRFTVPLGRPEILRRGDDATVVTYGPLCWIALEAAGDLAAAGVEVEVIDVQTLLPFDTEGAIVASLERTGRILFLDEDVPGGATAYMMQQVLERQGGFSWLDAPPRTLTAKEHRPAYGSDGDYFSKPSREQIFDALYELVREGRPRELPRF